MSVYCRAACMDAAAELLTALSAEVEITPTSSRGSSNYALGVYSLDHDQSNMLFFTANISTCDRIKNTGVTSNINDGSILYKCASKAGQSVYGFSPVLTWIGRHWWILELGRISARLVVFLRPVWGHDPWFITQTISWMSDILQSCSLSSPTVQFPTILDNWTHNLSQVAATMAWSWSHCWST